MEKSELPGELPLVLVPSVREALPSAPGEVFWTVEEARLKTRATEGVVIQNVPGVARPGCGTVGRFRPAVPPWDATRGTAHTSSADTPYTRGSRHCRAVATLSGDTCSQPVPPHTPVDRAGRREDHSKANVDGDLRAINPRFQCRRRWSLGLSSAFQDPCHSFPLEEKCLRVDTVAVRAGDGSRFEPEVAEVNTGKCANQGIPHGTRVSRR